MSSSNSLSLKYWPNPILRTVCTEMLDTSQADAIGQRMIQIMFENNGLGLSAPQVGLTERIFVMRDPDNHKKGLVFTNPVIVSNGNQEDRAEEGCLSYPDQRVIITRKKSIDVEFDVPTGYELPVGDDRITWHFEGLDARCIQHEIDHLNGIMIFDHIKSNLMRQISLDKYAKSRR